ncbi:Protein of unknown function DUF1075 family-containing protein [Strongyloides ratti]|uniref:Uncharacterized protein n=1 Tax=Strongyloides ratti TaxID=34506 RepID=A0A090N056_STRRB|nr:Protein of unknown function DUF1075 family-containing protein [Strongyloides ratti]CEF70100.1 Protein of unknown function DUF1075 family-containing protein [Strongyloides ratti]
MVNLINIKCSNNYRNCLKIFYPKYLSTTVIRRNETDKKVSETVTEKPKYVTASTFNDLRMKTKYSPAEDSSKGYIPTKFQKRMLVWTGMYKRKEDIPEFISPSTMNKLSDRYRISFVVVGCIVFFAIALLGEKYVAAKIEKDKKRGVVVTKM